MSSRASNDYVEYIKEDSDGSVSPPPRQPRQPRSPPRFSAAQKGKGRVQSEQHAAAQKGKGSSASTTADQQGPLEGYLDASLSSNDPACDLEHENAMGIDDQQNSTRTESDRSAARKRAKSDHIAEIKSTDELSNCADAGMAQTSEDAGVEIRCVHVRAWSVIGFGGAVSGKSKGWFEKLRECQEAAEADFEEIFGQKAHAGNLRQILLDGVSENANARVFDKIQDSHIPQGSRASEYLDIIRHFKPTDMIVVRASGNTCCVAGLKWLYGEMHKIVPELRIRYLIEDHDDWMQLLPLTPLQVVDLLDLKPGFEKWSRLYEVIDLLSYARFAKSLSEFSGAIQGIELHHDDRRRTRITGPDAYSAEPLVLAWGSIKSCRDALLEYGLDPMLGCEHPIANGNKLREHFYHAHTDDEDRQRCRFCGECFLTACDLVMHISRSHIDHGKEACPDPACQILAKFGTIRTFTPAALKTHMASSHSKPVTPEWEALRGGLYKLAEDVLKRLPARKPN